MVVGHLKQGTRERNKDTETKKVAMMIIIMCKTSYLVVEEEDSRTVGHNQAQAVGHSQEEEEL